jgi:hypothetical protein
MATSVSFHDHSFFTRSTELQFWLHVLAITVNQTPAVPEWLQNAGMYWEFQAHHDVGEANPNFDYIILDQGRKEVVRELVARTIERVASRGDHIPADEMTDMNLGGPTAGRFLRDGDVSALLRVGRAFLRLFDEQPYSAPGEIPIKRDVATPAIMRFQIEERARIANEYGGNPDNLIREYVRTWRAQTRDGIAGFRAPHYSTWCRQVHNSSSPSTAFSADLLRDSDQR